ncbi:hypothetical protein MLD38_029615 [Melastoma candidum]|uniref:Uncharacterized protein n=1 Tax=Melastoma candidum TaxID=119954 RepID=A0ACB9N5E6_9MYRT|nr:hypothetical protein MLD38_029615 [Melastoma candidum]
MEPSGSFRLRSFSRRVGRSNSCLLESELARSDDFGAIVGYQRLSESMRLTGERDYVSGIRPGKKRAGVVVGLFGRVFSFRRQRPEEGRKAEEMKKKKKRSSWLPDPDRRWPIQGW